MTLPIPICVYCSFNQAFKDHLKALKVLQPSILKTMEDKYLEQKVKGLTSLSVVDLFES